MRGRTNAVSGTVLPELSNPAGAANIQSGYQAINGEGEIVTGTYVPPEPEAVEYEFLSADDVSMSYGSRFELKLTLPKPIKTIVGLSLIYNSRQTGEVDAIFMHPAGTYNVAGDEDKIWTYIMSGSSGSYGNMFPAGISGNTVTYYISTELLNPANEQFYCGACKYIPA